MYNSTTRGAINDLGAMAYGFLPSQDKLITHVLSSSNKAVFLDASLVLAASHSVVLLPKVASISTAKYLARSAGKEVIANGLTEMGVDKNDIPTISAVSAAVVAGVIKGGLAGSNIPAEIINNMGYELCNLNEKCLTPVGATVANVVLETADPYLKSLFNAMGKDLLRMEFRGYNDEVENPYNIFREHGYLKPALLAMQGVVVVHAAFIPNMKFIPDLYACLKTDHKTSCFLDRMLDIIPSAANHLNDITFNYVPRVNQCMQAEVKLDCAYETTKEVITEIGDYLGHELRDISGYNAKAVDFSSGEEL